jgi:hypothetical protein
LTASERWRMNGQNTEVADKFNYREVGWNKQKILAKTKGYKVLPAI